MQKKASLRKRFSSLGIDAILITNLKNVRYLTGFTGTSGFVMITRQASLFLTDFRYQEQAKIEVKGYGIRREAGERSQTIQEIVSRYAIQRLGFESRHVSHQMYRRLLREKIRLRALTDTVEEMRLRKSREELLSIQRAVRRAEDAFRKLQPYIRVGKTEEMLAMKLEELLKKEGCKSLPFGVIVASGPRSALPHAQPTSRKIRKGDIVLFDWGGECGGYYSDMTRPVVMEGGNLSVKQRLFSVVREAQNRAIQSVRDGARAADVDEAARGYIREQGYDRYFGHGTGHGIGLEVHERPVLSWNRKETVESGMVFTIEPGVYLPNQGGIRIEDIVVPRGDGADLLTTLPRTLRVIKG